MWQKKEKVDLFSEKLKVRLFKKKKVKKKVDKKQKFLTNKKKPNGLQI